MWFFFVGACSVRLLWLRFFVFVFSVLSVRFKCIVCFAVLYVLKYGSSLAPPLHCDGAGQPSLRKFPPITVNYDMMTQQTERTERELFYFWI